MKKSSDICVIVQARLNSQRCQQKMVRKFGNTTLFNLACEKLELIEFPEYQKYVSIYENELIDIADKYKIKQFHRTEKSANADEGLSLIWQWCKYLPFKYYIMFNGCLPFLKVETIEKFINEFKISKNDIMFGVKPLRDYIWNQKGDLVVPPSAPKSGIMNTKSQDLINNQLFLAAHALYAGTLEDARNNTQLGSFNSDTLSLYQMEDNVELLDIDTEEDFRVCELMYNN